jgi:hypothetical protein
VPYLLLVFNLINILPSVLGISFDQILRFLFFSFESFFLIKNSLICTMFMLFEVSICSNGMLHVHVYTCLNVFYSILFLVLNNDAISTSVVFLLTYKLKDLYRLLMLS